MTDEDLARIETELEITLPERYRTAALAGRLSDLLNADATTLIAINRAFRGGEFGDENWPDEVFAFADNGSGDFYCIWLSSSAREVFYRDHETLELVLEAKDFDSWLASI